MPQPIKKQSLIALLLLCLTAKPGLTATQTPEGIAKFNGTVQELIYVIKITGIEGVDSLCVLREKGYLFYINIHQEDLTFVVSNNRCKANTYNELINDGLTDLIKAGLIPDTIDYKLDPIRYNTSNIYFIITFLSLFILPATFLGLRKK